MICSGQQRFRYEEMLGKKFEAGLIYWLPRYVTHKIGKDSAIPKYFDFKYVTLFL
jgi:hypothetical protein